MVADGGAMRSPSASSEAMPPKFMSIASRLKNRAVTWSIGLIDGSFKVASVVRIGRMNVQRYTGVGHIAVNGGMDRPCRWIGRIGPVHGVGIIGIDQQQFACLGAGEMFPARIDQELPAVG
jgi:hypothetical protein